MQIKRKNNLICLFLALAIVLSGMCFDYANADFLLSYEHSNKTTSTLNATDNRSENPDVRIEDISCSHLINSSIKSEKRGDESTISRSEAYLPSLVIFALNTTRLFTTVSDELHNSIYSNTVIVNYIHQKDGKKS